MILILSIILFNFMFLFLIAWIWYFKSETKTAKKLYEQGFEAFKQKNYKKAIKLFLKSLDLQSDFKDSLFWLGLSYLELKEWDEAKASFQKTLKLNPKDFNALFNLAVTLQAQNNWEEAKEFYNKAIKENDKNPDCYFNLGLISFVQNSHEEALEYFQKAKEYSPKNGKISFYIARCKDETCSYETTEDGKSVIEEYLKVTSLEDVPPIFYKVLAKACAKTGLINEAIANCEKALVVDDKDVDSYNLLGLIQLIRNESDKAQNSLSTAISLGKNNTEAYDILSYALCQNKDRTVAQKCRLKYQEMIKKPTVTK